MNFRGMLFVSLVMITLTDCSLGVSSPTTVVEEVTTGALPAVTETPPIVEEVQHLTIPGELPENQSGLAGDQDSSTLSLLDHGALLYMIFVHCDKASGSIVVFPDILYGFY